MEKLTTDRFSSRNQQYMAVPMDELHRLREGYAVKLRKDKTRARNYRLRQRGKRWEEDVGLLIEKYPEYYGLNNVEKLRMLFTVLFYREDSELVYHALICLRKLFILGLDEVCRESLRLNLIDLLSKYLSRDLPDKVVGEVTWVLCNMAHNSECVDLMVKKNLIDMLLELIDEDNIITLDNTLWTLANIAADNNLHRNTMLKYRLHDFISSFLQKLIVKSNFSAIEIASWLLSVLSRGDPKIETQPAETMINVCKQLMKYNNDKILKYSLCTIHSLSDSCNEIIQSLFDASLIKEAIKCLDNEKHKIVQIAIEIVSNISSRNSLFMENMLRYGLLDKLRFILSSIKSGIRKEAFFTIGNIAAGTLTHRELLCSSRLIPCCIQGLNDPDFSCKNESSIALLNIARLGITDQVLSLIQLNIFDSLKNCLTISDPRFLLNILGIIRAILELETKREIDDELIDSIPYMLDDSGCLEELEILKDHGNERVSSMTSLILEDFFGHECTASEELEEDIDIFSF